MAKNTLSKMQVILLAGDLIALALITAYGFASHGTLGSAGARIWSTFLPVLVAWLLVGPLMGVYDLALIARLTDVWRPFLAMVVAGPLAAWLRSLMLGGTVIMPIFVVVLGGFSALGLLAWRILFWIFFSRKRQTI